MLPKPSLRFTIPSIHDHLSLDCRVFHPSSLTSPSPKIPPQWGRHVAIVAHPYAPLGGCYDDPIVDLVAGTLLQAGFMVATFNFRGASTAGGRTSWTSRPEQADYTSVVAFMAYYAHYIDFPGRIAADNPARAPTLLQAGYSYGAMVTTKLPPLAHMLAPFDNPAVHSDAADIRLRAQHLAELQNKLSAGPASPRRSMGMRVGGDEDVSRRSHDNGELQAIDREDRIRRGVKDVLLRTKRIHRSHRHRPHDQAGEVTREEECMVKVENMQTFRSAYLLVSPPIGLVTNLATMSFPNPFGSWYRKPDKSGQNGNSHDLLTANVQSDAADLKLSQNPTLAIYGDRDGFITLRKMREWAVKLGGPDSSRFRSVEIAGAGHFWMEDRTMHKLRDVLGQFGTELLGMRSYDLQPLDGA